MKNKKAINNILFSFIQQLVNIVCGFIVPRLIILKFGSNINGVISSISQFLAYITLLEAGIAPVVKATLYKPILLGKKNEIENILKATEKFFRNISLIFVAYMLILCFGFSEFYIAQYDRTYTFTLVAIIAISTFFEYFFGMTYGVYLQAKQCTYVVAIIKTISKLINTVIVVILMLNNYSIHIVKIASAGIFILSPLVQNYYVKKKFGINLKNADSTFKLENKWNGLSQHIAAVVHSSVDVAVLTFVSTSIEVSVYSVYMLIVNSIKSITLSFAGGIDALFGNIIAKGNNEDLNTKFRLYEVFYYTVIAILFACTYILIVPFVTVYTDGVTDANYIRPVFAAIMVVSEFIMAIRIPFNNLALAAGHFKQIRVGSWIEAIVNIALSTILVFKYGIIGVAIGTLVAMIIRTTEFIFYSTKNILKKDVMHSLRRIFILIAEFVVVIVVCSIFIKPIGIISYFNWFVYAIKVGGISILIVGVANVLIYKKEVLEMKKYILSRRK